MKTIITLIFALLFIISYAQKLNADLVQEIITTTNSNDALAYNNGRKLALCPDRTLALVFTNNKDVYYTELESNNLKWSEPINISKSNGISAHPAIAVDKFNRKHIVWQDNTSPDFSKQTDRFRIYYQNFITPNELLNLPIPIGESVGDCLTPSITIYQKDKLLVVWAADMGLTLGREINYSIGTLIGNGILGVYAWSYPTILGSAMGMGGSFFPAVASFLNDQVVSWLERGPTESVVNLMRYRIDEDWSKYLNISAAAIGPYPFSNAGTATLLIGPDSAVDIVCNEKLSVQDNTFDDIFHLNFQLGDSLSYAQGINISKSGWPSRHPSLSKDHQENNIYVVWQENIGNHPEIFFSMCKDKTWSSPENISNTTSSSRQPQLSVQSVNSVQIVWLEGDHSPYQIMYKKMESPISYANAGPNNSTSTMNDLLLFQNFPNPFNSSTVINYYLPFGTHVALSVYDICGRQIKTIINEYKNKGHHTVSWDATDDYNRKVNSGLFMIVLESQLERRIIKTLVLK